MLRVLALLPVVVSGWTPLVRTSAIQLVSRTSPAAASRSAVAMNGNMNQPPDGWNTPNWDGPDGRWSHMNPGRNAHQARFERMNHILNQIEIAWVLIFNLGQPNEGVYTLQERTEIGETSHVLVFALAEDAARFAAHLQADGFDLPQPTRWAHQQLVNFCDSTQFDISLVPPGAPVTPPTKNEYDKEAFERIGLGGDEDHGFDRRQTERMRLERGLELADDCKTEDSCDVDAHLDDRVLFERSLMLTDEVCDVDEPDACGP